MNSYEILREEIPLIEERIGYAFKDRRLLMLAFVHRSFYNEHRNQVEQHNERMEFLGDSVLNILISEYLYKNCPSYSEGHLSHVRSHLIDAGMCAKLLQKLSLAPYILLGRGEKMSEGRNKESIQADFFEALLGALFLDGGIETAKAFFWSHFKKEVEDSLQEPARNWKAELQEYSQKKFQKPPVYKVLGEEGPDHSKLFHVAVYLEEEDLGHGVGLSKKEAEQEAARQALVSLKEQKNG
jgi:ribonuclease-3